MAAECFSFRLARSSLAHTSEHWQALGEKLVTNQERFEQLCVVLNDQSVPPAERLQRIDAIVGAIGRNCFVGESNLRIETMLGAARLTSQLLLTADATLPSEFAERLQRFVSAPQSPDEFESLAALHALHDMKRSSEVSSAVRPARGLLLQLADIIWHYTFMHYFWLKQQRAPKQPLNSDTSQTPV